MNKNIELLPQSYRELSDEEIQGQIARAKEQLGKDLIILGHHYQMDSVIQFADKRGDSLALAQFASQQKRAKYVVFCGVHFMAESADMLTNPEQSVILPDIDAGCSMADMAEIDDVESAWKTITEITKDKVIPITYINSAASLKAFCGRHDGAVCTSSNAQKIIEWAFKQGKKLFFFPDQHLGRNTAFKLGIALEEMILWNPKKNLGGNSESDIQNSKVILWNGFCSIHEMFKTEHIENWRKNDPDINIIVHPECPFELVQKADYAGSTSYIINTIKNAGAGTKWAVGTEVNLVNRLKNELKDREVHSLSPFQCLCSTMFRIRPPYLLHVLDQLLNDRVVNQVVVPEDEAHWARVSLDRMLSLS
ncbi:MAG: quinolinate synthase NadA [Spirochaetota bacterium]|nr:quinolinate synthase NadA [Spirochaetota bacterium]